MPVFLTVPTLDDLTLGKVSAESEYNSFRVFSLYGVNGTNNAHHARGIVIFAEPQ